MLPYLGRRRFQHAETADKTTKATQRVTEPLANINPACRYLIPLIKKCCSSQSPHAEETGLRGHTSQATQSKQRIPTHTVYCLGALCTLPLT